MTTEQALVPIEQGASVTVFGTDDPAAIMRRVVDIATPLAEFVRAKHMSKKLGRRDDEREYVQIEGWSFMGAMLGIAPITREVKELRDPETGNLLGFEARVELVNRAGEVVGGGIGECSWAERNWHDREPYALKSMAQTRATGKAFRLALGFVMAAAGFEATPAEEMPSEERGQQTVLPPRPRSQGSVTASDFFTATWKLHKVSRDDALNIEGVPEAIDISDFEKAAQLVEEHVAQRQPVGAN